MTLIPNLFFVKYIFISLFCFALDLYTKYLIKIKFSENIGSGFYVTSDGQYELSVINPFLMIKRISNKGIAWGIDGSGTYGRLTAAILLQNGTIKLFRTTSTKACPTPAKQSAWNLA